MSDNLVSVCPKQGSPCVNRQELALLQSQVNELAELVRTDPLTGLFNIRHLNQTLVNEMERTARIGESTILIMLDLDYFKHVNDRWGHEVGNQALKLTAQSMLSAIRKLDLACRYGGEEFAVVLPMTDLLTGIIVAERIRQAIEGAPLLIDGEDIQLTASFGVAVFNGYRQESPESFVARADHCLYQAKQSGRNKVCHEVIESLKDNNAVSVDEKAALSGLFDN
mgnify:CR=1 FL=1